MCDPDCSSYIYNRPVPCKTCYLASRHAQVFGWLGLLGLFFSRLRPASALDLLRTGTRSWDSNSTRMSIFYHATYCHLLPPMSAEETVDNGYDDVWMSFCFRVPGHQATRLLPFVGKSWSCCPTTWSLLGLKMLETCRVKTRKIWFPENAEKFHLSFLFHLLLILIFEPEQRSVFLLRLLTTVEWCNAECGNLKPQTWTVGCRDKWQEAIVTYCTCLTWGEVCLQYDLHRFNDMMLIFLDMPEKI